MFHRDAATPGTSCERLRPACFSTRRVAPSRASTPPSVEALAQGLAALARRRRAAVHPRRRRFGRPRQPRRQRLPQDLRLRGLRADRQRLRADRARQRRGLGDQLLRVAEGLAPRARATACWSSRSAAAAARRTCRSTWCARSSWRRRRAPRCSASSARTAAPPQSADACVVIPTVSPDRITPHTEGLCAVVWHLLVSHPALKRAATKWESTK